ncbi:MAG: helix-turn-helix domain-containing protein [Oligoflexia bacterium]|nr:helix-turn-helix domain-containing protein [Oligoflexia bacterium]
MRTLFATLGFADRERDVFQKLSEVAGASPNELARILSIPRASVYSALAALEKRGLVYTEKQRKGVRYLPQNPAALITMVEREQAAAMQAHAARVIAAEQLAALLKPIAENPQQPHPRVAVFEGQASVEQMLIDRLSSWRASFRQYDSTWWGYQDHDLIEKYGRWFRIAAAQHQAPEQVKLLSNQSPTEKLLKGRIGRREMRLVPPQMAFSSTIWVLGDYLITILTRQEPHHAFEIWNPALAQNLRTVFQMLWQLSGKPS